MKGERRQRPGDILDASGAEPSPFTGLPIDPEAHAQVTEKTPWHLFRMYTEGAVALYASLEANDVTVLSAGTGSGKTVIAPKVAHVWAKRRADAACADMAPSGPAAKASGPAAPASGPAATSVASKVGADDDVLSDSADDDGGDAVRRRPLIPRTVAVTNPKRLTTLKNAEFSARLAHGSLGREIGYHYRGAPQGSATAGGVTQLEYATDGWLLQRARDDPLMSNYAVIVVDEVHERPVPTDFLMLAAVKAMHARRRNGSSSRRRNGSSSRQGSRQGSRPGSRQESRPVSRRGGDNAPHLLPLRLVVMSATLDAAFLAGYFKRAGLSVGVVEVGGLPNFPIRTVHRPLPRGEEGEYLEAAVRHVLDIHADPSSAPGAVLVFVPVKRDASKGCRLLQAACKARGMDERCLVAISAGAEDEGGGAPGGTGVECMPLYANMGPDAENRAQRAPPAGTRNVIFATNVAESSLTIESLDYVVDTGRAFVVRFSAETGAVVSGKEWITRAQAKQRLGRVGREREGTAVLMYPESFLKGDALPDDSPPRGRGNAGAAGANNRKRGPRRPLVSDGGVSAGRVMGGRRGRGVSPPDAANDGAAFRSSPVPADRRLPRAPEGIARGAGEQGRRRRAVRLRPVEDV